MTAYRLYRLDGAGKITTAEWIEASTDEEAVEEARPLLDGGKYELWDKHRLVAQLGNDAA